MQRRTVTVGLSVIIGVVIVFMLANRPEPYHWPDGKTLIPDRSRMTPEQIEEYEAEFERLSVECFDDLDRTEDRITYVGDIDYDDAFDELLQRWRPKLEHDQPNIWAAFSDAVEGVRSDHRHMAERAAEKERGGRADGGPVIRLATLCAADCDQQTHHHTRSGVFVKRGNSLDQCQPGTPMAAVHVFQVLPKRVYASKLVKIGTNFVRVRIVNLRRKPGWFARYRSFGKFLSFRVQRFDQFPPRKPASGNYTERAKCKLPREQGSAYLITY